MSGWAWSSSPVPWFTKYPPSVMVSVAMRQAGEASFSTTASGSSGASRYSCMDPITRGRLPAALRSTTV